MHFNLSLAALHLLAVWSSPGSLFSLKIKISIISLLGSAKLTGIWVVWVQRNSPTFGWFGSDCDDFITIRDILNQGKSQGPQPYYCCFAKISVHRLFLLSVNVLVCLLVFVFCPVNRNFLFRKGFFQILKLSCLCALYAHNLWLWLDLILLTRTWPYLWTNCVDKT